MQAHFEQQRGINNRVYNVDKCIVSAAFG